jgi:hypothetical protein
MSKPKLYIDNVLTEYQNDGISFDFVAQDGSPNSVLINDIIFDLYSTADSDPLNGNRSTDLKLQNGSPFSTSDIRLVDDQLGLLFEGLGLYGSEKSEYGFNTNKLFVQSTFESFLVRSENLNLKTLYKNNAISRDNRFEDSDFSRMYYTLAQVPDYANAAILIITIYLFTKALIDNIEKLAKAFNPLNSGDIIPTTISILVTIIALTQMLIDLSDTIFQKPYQYYAVNIIDLCTKACKQLGFEFKSEFLETNYKTAHIIAETDTVGALSGKKPRNNPIPNWTLSQLFIELRNTFNTRLKIENGIVRLEKLEYYYKNAANFTIEEMQETPTSSFRINELPLNFSLVYTNDATEKNTLSEKNRNSAGDEGVTKVNVFYAITSTTGQDFSYAKNAFVQSRESLDIEIGFARFFRKTKTTNLEKLFNGIYDTFSRLINGTNPLGGSRVNMGLLETHLINEPKIFCLANEKIDVKNEVKLNALYLYENWHKPSQIIGKYGRKTYVSVNAPNGIYGTQSGNPDVFLRILRENNICKTWFGADAFVTKHLFNVETRLHEYEFYVLEWRNRIGDKWTILNNYEISEKIIVE